MRLYLSSYLIPDAKVFTDFIGLEPKEIKIGWISNAKDHKSPEERLEKTKELLGYFAALGFACEEVNLLHYLGGQGLFERLKQFNVLWFGGGNTFCLRWAIEQSKAGDIIRQCLMGGIVYGGDSAGAIIAGPTLKYFDRGDDPSFAPEVLRDGLNLVGFSVLPHWRSEKFGDALKIVKEDLEKDGYKTVPLTDNECVLVEEGGVVKIKP